MARTKKTAGGTAGPNETPAPESEPKPKPKPKPSGRQSKFLRLFLMAGGALAAPSLALAAFFFSDTRDPAPAKQAGSVTTTTRAASTPGTPTRTAAAPTTTTTTTAPVITSAAGLRDPFAPLVSPGPAPGSPAR